MDQPDPDRLNINFLGQSGRKISAGRVAHTPAAGRPQPGDPPPTTGQNVIPGTARKSKPQRSERPEVRSMLQCSKNKAAEREPVIVAMPMRSALRGKAIQSAVADVLVPVGRRRLFVRLALAVLRGEVVCRSGLPAHSIIRMQRRVLIGAICQREMNPDHPAPANPAVVLQGLPFKVLRPPEPENN